jgi:hypothetical protein
MSIAMATSLSGLYSPAQDSALSPTGAELRDCIEIALTPPTEPRGDQTTILLTRINAALKKGVETEGVFLDVDPFGRMFDLLRVLPSDVPLPEIVVESGREIGLDWNESSRRVLSLTVDDTPYLGFAALFGHEPIHGRLPFDGSLPKTLAYLFSRLYPSERVTAA